MRAVLVTDGAQDSEMRQFQKTPRCESMYGCVLYTMWHCTTLIQRKLFSAANIYSFAVHQLYLPVRGHCAAPYRQFMLSGS